MAIAATVAALVGGCGGDDTGGEPPAELPYHEWSFPAGAPGAARGVVLTLHGGSWRLTGKGAAAAMEPEVEDLTRQGYAVLNGSYPQRREGIEGVEALYELADERAGDRGVCVYGRSAGGHWALELAIRHPEIRCVVGEAPPTDLEALARTSPPAKRFLTETFGRDLRAFSPVRGPFSASTRILIAGVTNDRIVPWSQAQRFKDAWPRTRLFPVRPGRARWVHAFANADDLRRYAGVASRFLARSLRR